MGKNYACRCILRFFWKHIAHPMLCFKRNEALPDWEPQSLEGVDRQAEQSRRLKHWRRFKMNRICWISRGLEPLKRKRNKAECGLHQRFTHSNALLNSNACSVLKMHLKDSNLQPLHWESGKFSLKVLEIWPTTFPSVAVPWVYIEKLWGVGGQ